MYRAWITVETWEEGNTGRVRFFGEDFHGEAFRGSTDILPVEEARDSMHRTAALHRLNGYEVKTGTVKGAHL